ncbi:MAG TPA: hypothetical protein VJZ27_20215, partial [Aggregatilineales bacterium]|nr:hypothetical protein [Aggregatilineales bacterium]
LGLVTLLKNRLTMILAAGLVYYAVFSIFITIPNAFRLPDTPDVLPDDVRQVDVQYGDVRLLGYKISSDAITPDHRLDVTLYWQPLAQTNQPLSFYIQVFAPGLNGQTVEVGKLDSYPGRGLLQTDSWNPGMIYEDRYHLEFDENAEKLADFPFEPRLKIGWRDNETDTEIPASTAAGESIESVIVRGGRVWKENASSEDSDTLAIFGNVIRLRGVEVEPDENILRVYLRWQAIEDIPEDFTVFIQLIDPANPSEILASGDSVPRADWWRSSLWIPGDIFDDRYTVSMGENLIPGDYRLLIGFYRPADFTRLPIDRGDYPDAYTFDVSIP